MAQDQRRAQRDGPSHAAVDVVAAVVIMLVGVVMMVDNHKIGAGWADDGPESGYFPFRIGAILCLAGLVVAGRSLLGRQRDPGLFVSRERLRRVLLVLLPAAAYVLAIQFVGIYVASTLFIAGFMRVLDRSSWLKTLLVSVGSNALLFWMFELQFKVPLPKGPLEAFFGY